MGLFSALGQRRAKPVFVVLGGWSEGSVWAGGTAALPFPMAVSRASSEKESEAERQ